MYEEVKEFEEISSLHNFLNYEPLEVEKIKFLSSGRSVVSFVTV